MVKLPSAAVMAIALFLLVCCVDLRDDQLHADEIAFYMELARSRPSREIVISCDAINAIGMTSPEHVRSLIPAASEAVSIDFLAKNQKDLILRKEDVPLEDGFILMGSNNLTERLSRLGRWNSFSRVGFDRTRKTAIVWYSDVCVALCGEAGLYLLEHNGEKWLIVAESEKIKS